MQTVETQTTLLIGVRNLLAKAYGTSNKTHNHPKGWSVFWKHDEYELDIYYSDTSGYRFGMATPDVGINAVITDEILFFDKPTVIGEKSAVIRALEHCDSIWKNGIIE